jgi:integrase
VSAAEIVPSGRAEIAGWTDTDRSLGADTIAWLNEAMPANTRRAYEWAWTRFTGWCARHDRLPLPASAETATEYVAHLRAETAAPATIDQALGVVLAAHGMANVTKPDLYRARALLRGYRRQLAEDGILQRQAPPITADVLQQTVASLDLTTVLGRRNRLLLVLGFMMMARRSELAALRFDDVREDTEGLTVTVRTSKTDHQSQGRVVSLPARAKVELDPVRLFRGWRDEVGGAGALLRYLDLRGQPAGHLTGHGVNHAVRAAVRRAGIADADTYTAHSLRAGGLTDALHRQVPLAIAARHGGWNPESPTVLRYARVADRWRDNAMSGVFE